MISTENRANQKPRSIMIEANAPKKISPIVPKIHYFCLPASKIVKAFTISQLFLSSANWKKKKRPGKRRIANFSIFLRYRAGAAAAAATA